MPNETQQCPHCKGATKCACGSGGTQKPVYKGFQQSGVEMVAGICKVCQGRGYIL
jgi:hypothetical protein